jgi:hypothetical protein
MVGSRSGVKLAVRRGAPPPAWGKATAMVASSDHSDDRSGLQWLSHHYITIIITTTINVII